MIGNNNFHDYRYYGCQKQSNFQNSGRNYHTHHDSNENYYRNPSYVHKNNQRVHVTKPTPPDLLEGVSCLYRYIVNEKENRKKTYSESEKLVESITILIGMLYCCEYREKKNPKLCEFAFCLISLHIIRGDTHRFNLRMLREACEDYEIALAVNSVLVRDSYRHTLKDWEESCLHLKLCELYLHLEKPEKATKHSDLLAHISSKSSVRIVLLMGGVEIPIDEIALDTKAQCLKKMKKYDEAADMYRYLLNRYYELQSEGLLKAYDHLGVCLEKLENYDEAINVFQELEKVAKGMNRFAVAIFARRKIVVCYLKMGKMLKGRDGCTKSAIECFKNGIKILDEVKELYEKMREERDRFCFDKRECRAWKGLKSDFYRNYWNKAELCEEMYKLTKEERYKTDSEKAHEEAKIILLNRKKNNQSLNSIRLFDLGSTFFLLADYESANEHWESALEETSGSENMHIRRKLYNRRQKLFLRRNMYQNAHKDFKSMLAEDPKDQHFNPMKMKKEGKYLKNGFQEVEDCGPFCKPPSFSPGSERLTKDRKLIEFEKNNLKEMSRESGYLELSILEKLGSGTFADVFMCKSKSSDFPFLFAVKILKKNSKEMIQKDEIPKMLEYHPHIAPVYGTFKCSLKIGLPSIPKVLQGVGVVMKIINKDLYDFAMKRKEKKRPFSDLELCFILEGLLKAIVFLHKNKIVHRDIYPKNIFVSEYEGRLWIGDFGCNLNLSHVSSWTVSKEYAKLEISMNRSKSRFGGKDDYLPPEIKSCEGIIVDYKKCDVFSVGKVMDFLIEENREEELEISGGDDDDGDGRVDKVNINLKNLVKDMTRSFKNRILPRNALERLKIITIRITEESESKIKTQDDETW